MVSSNECIKCILYLLNGGLGIRMLDQPYMTDLIEANSMGHEPHKIHIYSASWGPTDDGKTVDGPRNATMRAIVQGVNEVSVLNSFAATRQHL